VVVDALVRTNVRIYAKMVAEKYLYHIGKNFNRNMV